MNKAIVQKINLQLHSDDGDINKYKCANAPNPALFCAFSKPSSTDSVCAFSKISFLSI